MRLQYGKVAAQQMAVRRSRTVRRRCVQQLRYAINGPLDIAQFPAEAVFPGAHDGHFGVLLDGLFRQHGQPAFQRRPVFPIEEVAQSLPHDFPHQRGVRCLTRMEQRFVDELVSRIPLGRAAVQARDLVAATVALQPAQNKLPK